MDVNFHGGVALPRALVGRNGLLVVAHPGHELRVHGWLEQARPVVWVMTDGSGHAGEGRLSSTARLLARAGCAPGAVFGRLADRDAYRLIMERQVAAVAGLVEELAATMVDRVDYVVADACEGFNPVHDLCRLVVDAATLVARRSRKRPTDSFEFALGAGPGWHGGGEELSWHLPEEAWRRKLEAARTYAELAGDVNRALQAYGEDAFRTERIHRVEPLRTLVGRFDGKPQYEIFGEQRVAAGHYRQVLRHGEHFAPLVTAVRAQFNLDGPA